MSCLEIIADYGLRSIGFGERLLPRSDFTLCHQFTLIGSGMIWNIYFGTLALTSGFILATLLALGKVSKNFYVKKNFYRPRNASIGVFWGAESESEVRSGEK